MKNYTLPKLLVTGYWLLVTVLRAGPAFAIETGLNATAGTAGFTLGGPSLAARIGALIGIALSLVGVVFLVLIVYGGFLWMTAGGEPEKIKKAKSLITNAIIGLVIVAAGYAITSFVLESVLTATL